MRIYPQAFLSSIRHSDDKQPGSLPWGSHTGQRRAAHMSGDGFVELQQTNETQSPETPPEALPKDTSRYR